MPFIARTGLRLTRLLGLAGLRFGRGAGGDGQRQRHGCAVGHGLDGERRRASRQPGGNRDLQCGGVAVLDGRGADLGAVDRGDQLGLGGHAQRGERELRELQIERGAGRDLAIGRDAGDGHRATVVARLERRVLGDVVDPCVTVDQTGVLRVLAGGEGAEVVAALQQEREGADAVLALEVERLAVHGHRSDVIALRRVRIIGVGDVVRQAELQVRAGRHVAVGVGLPLLFEGFLELGSGERGGPQVVEERQHGVGLGIGDGAVGGDRALLVVAGLAEFGAQAAGVHHADFGAAAVLGRQ